MVKCNTISVTNASYMTGVRWNTDCQSAQGRGGVQVLRAESGRLRLRSCLDLPGILQQLARYGILSTGRFGAWEYGSMGSAIRQGREAALSLEPLEPCAVGSP